MTQREFMSRSWFHMRILRNPQKVYWLRSSFIKFRLFSKVGGWTGATYFWVELSFFRSLNSLVFIKLFFWLNSSCKRILWRIVEAQTFYWLILKWGRSWFCSWILTDKSWLRSHYCLPNFVLSSFICLI